MTGPPCDGTSPRSTPGSVRRTSRWRVPPPHSPVGTSPPSRRDPAVPGGPRLPDVRTATTIAELRGALDAERCAGRTVGLVPTMGYLHAGHVSLIERAVAENDVVVTTIFVNPLQFAAGEDLDTYPRDPDGDAAQGGSGGCGLALHARPGGDVPGGSRGGAHRGLGRRALDGDGRRLTTHPLRRRLHGGRQALQHRRPVPGVLRREGLPAARDRAPHGGGPVGPRRGDRLPDRARTRRPRDVEPQRLPQRRGACDGAGAAPCPARGG